MRSDLLDVDIFPKWLYKFTQQPRLSEISNRPGPQQLLICPTFHRIDSTPFGWMVKVGFCLQDL